MRPIETDTVASFAKKLCGTTQVSGQTLLVTDIGTATKAVSLWQVDDTLLDKLRPRIVVTPLVSAAFDAMDVAETLYCAGYTGELIVMATALPSPRIVEQELRDCAPGLRVTLSMPDKATGPH
jgi:hypothetical protein